MPRRKRVSWAAFGTFLFIVFLLGVLALEAPPRRQSEELAVGEQNQLGSSAVQTLLQTPIADDPSAESSSEVRTVDVNGTKRHYRFVAPVGTPQGIVIAFHPSGASPETLAEASGLDAIVDAGLGLAYPVSLQGGWQIAQADGALLSDNADILFCLEVMTALTTELGTSRVSLVGVRDGASFAQLFGAVNSASIDAIVAHSGTRSDNSPPITGSIRFLAVHTAGSPDQNRIQQEVRLYENPSHAPQIMAIPANTEWPANLATRVREFLTTVP